MAKIFFVKLYNLFFVYFPTILIILCIFVVYGAYVFNYLFIMIDVNESTKEEDFMLTLTTSLSSSRTKGKVLLIFSSIIFLLFLISFLRTIFADPGYFPSPLELEYSILKCEKHFPTTGSRSRSEKSNKRSKQYNDNDIIEISDAKDSNDKNDSENNNDNIDISEKILNFSEYALRGPLTTGEKIRLDKKLKKEYSDANPKHTKKPSTESLSDNEEQSLISDNNMHYSNEEIIRKNKMDYMKRNKEKWNIFGFGCSSNTEIYKEIYKGTNINKMAFCTMCLRLKVERSHHCRQCQKCVLKMDHHCPWLANCIGFYNLKYFLLMQLYGTILSLLFLLTFWESIIGYNASYRTNIGKCWFSIVAYLLGLGLFSFLIWLVSINWVNLFKGQTVIENSERQRFPSSKTINIYDMGWQRNFTNVFGRCPLLWILPIYPNLDGKGLVFETKKEFYIQ